MDFFETLFQFCEGYIELRPLPNAKDRHFIHCTDDLSQIKDFRTTHKDRDLYFGVSTRDGKGGRAENIIDTPCVWCDLDFDKTPREVIADKLKRFPFKPSIVVASGGGVHLYWLLREPSRDFKAIVDINHRIADQLAGDLNACDIARVLRIPGTTNHKYPAPCKVHRIDNFAYELDNFLDVLPKVTAKPNGEGLKAKDPSWLSRAMQGVSQGDRNTTGAQIAGYWINKLSPDETLSILKVWNRANNPPMVDADIEKIVNSVSRYKQEEKKSKDIDNVYNPKRMLEEYQIYIETLKQNRFVTGITNVDNKIRGIGGGEVLTIIARAGSYKTALLQNLLRNYVKSSSMAAVFFSLEMPVASITERYHEILNSLSGQDAERLYSEHPEEQIRKDLEQNFLDELENFFVVPIKIRLSDIGHYIKLIEDNYHVKVGVVGIDYMGLMDCHGSNEYEVISNLAKGIKTTAKSINIPIVLLSQVSRKGGEGETEITMDHGRGSGAIEEAADFILGLWQVEKEDSGGLVVHEHKYNLICKILKNRKGPRGSRWILDLNPSTFAIGADSQEYDPPKRQRQF